MARDRLSPQPPRSLHPTNSNVPYLLLLCFSYLALSSLATARLVNITVDDTNPDPLTGATFTYSPAGRWAQGNGCALCVARLNLSKVHDGTWHDATYDPGYPELGEVQTASFSFNGTAFYVYGALSQANDETLDSNSDISFLIDGQPAGDFEYTPPSPGIPLSYVYDHLLWHTDSLPIGQHTFTLQNGRPGGNSSLILFDYVVYTRDDGTADSSAATTASSNSAGSTSSLAQSPPPSISQTPPPGVSQTPPPGVSQTPPPSMPQSPPPNTANDDKHSETSNSRTIIIACVVSISVAVIAVAVIILYRRHSKRQVLQGQWDTHTTTGEDGFEATPFVVDDTTRGQMEAVSPGLLPGASLNASSPWLTSGYLHSLSSADTLSPAVGGPDSHIEKDGTDLGTDDSPPAYDSLPLQRAPTSGR